MVDATFTLTPLRRMDHACSRHGMLMRALVSASDLTLGPCHDGDGHGRGRSGVAASSGMRAVLI